MARKNEYLSQVEQFIGAKISASRLSKGWSRAKLAEMVALSPQQLDKYKTAIECISIGRLILLAEALEENIEFFFDGLENIHNPKPLVVTQQNNESVLGK